jgi:hypothetical protein
LPKVNIAGALIAAAHAAAAERQVPAPAAAEHQVPEPFVVDELQLGPYRVPATSWSLLSVAP